MSLASTKRPEPQSSGQFDAFLSGRLRDEPNGMSLTAFSVFARLNLDPYREAARLADMTGQAAAISLANMLKRLDGAPAPIDAMALAPIIKLLPRLDAVVAALPSAPARLSMWQLCAAAALVLTVAYVLFA